MELASLLRPSAAEVLYNRRVKINPLTGEVLEDVCFSRPIFNPTHAQPLKSNGRSISVADIDAELFELEEMTTARYERLEAAEAERQAESVRRSSRRARKALFELCACNDFDLFFTLTLAPAEIDRYDYKAAVRKLTVWLDNRVRRKGLRYVAVPELHKDGAVHFHGLCNSSALRLVDSGHRDARGHAVYNIADWVLGFTTAIKLYGDRMASAHYVAKYVTKATGSETDGTGKRGTIGGRYYFHGGELRHAQCLYTNEDFSTFGGKEVEIDGTSLRCKYAASR